MITDCFDDKTEPVISLRDFYGEQKHLIETCLILFSQKIYQHLRPFLAPAKAAKPNTKSRFSRQQ